MPTFRFCKEKVKSTDTQCEHCGKKLTPDDIKYSKEDLEAINALYTPILGGFVIAIIVYFTAPLVNPYFRILGVPLFICSIIMAILMLILKKNNRKKLENQ